MSNAYTAVELLPAVMGVSALNAYVRHISSARIAMFCSHIGQALVVEGATINRTLTGAEVEYAKDDHSIVFPCNATVIKVIHRFPKTFAHEPVTDNPLSAVIFEHATEDTREVDILLLEKYHCLHQHFGFNYVYTEEASRLKPNESFKKGTILAHSPCVKANGQDIYGYAYGIEAQVAMMSVPSIIEDGIVVSEDFRHKIKTKGYGSRTVSWGAGSIPLNVNGDPNNPDDYQPFPHIGQRVNENGILFATRNYEEMLSVASMSDKALRKVDFFDKAIYAPPGARVIDVIVYKGNKNKTFLSEKMAKQMRYYYDKTYQFYKQIVDEYYRLRKLYGNGLKLSPRFSNFIVKAEVFLRMDQNTHITPRYKKRQVEEWLIEIVFEYDIIPNIGFKLTGQSGDKGVIVDIWPTEDMPIDESGNRADVITDDNSTIKRMNPSRVYEQYINASARKTALNIEDALMEGRPLNETWDYLYNFYRLVSPNMLPYLDESCKSDMQKRRHLENVARDGIYRDQPTDNPVDYVEVIDTLRREYPAPYGPVKYRGRKGQMITTKLPVLIGGMYMMLLEKTGNTWQAVASAKTQHYGIPAKINNNDKHTSPGREQAVRIFGESEVRLISAICGGDIVADLLDQTNNPMAHRHITETILTADNPLGMERVIDRTKIPVGNGRTITLFKHIMECSGIRFVRGNYANV